MTKPYKIEEAASWIADFYRKSMEAIAAGLEVTLDAKLIEAVQEVIKQGAMRAEMGMRSAIIAKLRAEADGRFELGDTASCLIAATLREQAASLETFGE